MVQDSICCTTVRYPTLERANVRASHCVFFRKNGKFPGNVSRGRRRCHAFVASAFQNLPVSSLPSADLAAEDFFGGLISRCQSRVRFTPKSGHVQCNSACPLWAKSGHRYSYSITSSARVSNAGGTARPSTFAVLRLMTSSNLVGCCTGRRSGFSPWRIRPVYLPTRRSASLRLLP
jgi:hypothetical protein